jgi:RNA polymerase sigma-70 factor (ECF subfamily)
MGVDCASQTGTTLKAVLRDPADPQAWKAFVRRYTPKVLAWCRRWHLQPADAQDVTQEVLYKLARQLREFHYDPAKGHFRSWLKTVTRHVWSDLCESRRRAGWGSGDPHVQRLLDEQEDRASLPEALEDAFVQEVYEEARTRVQLRVSRQTWEAFRLVVVDNWPGDRVAAQLGMKVAAVYRSKHRVRQMLQEEIHKLGGAG